MIDDYENLRAAYSYNEITGIFTRVDNGAECLNESSQGYIRIQFKGSQREAHRLAWLYVYGRYPENSIDHINGDKRDNSISNLRDVTALDNMRNMRLRNDNSSGITGVSWVKKSGAWQSGIRCRGEFIYLGTHKTILKRRQQERARKESMDFMRTTGLAESKINNLSSLR